MTVSKTGRRTNGKWRIHIDYHCNILKLQQYINILLRGVADRGHFLFSLAFHKIILTQYNILNCFMTYMEAL
ncbi:hypothetical protein [Acetohalobium arabaticum]|uniref:hypothetical protein n=1 Tax=Acetohalobium arabaticum TaxID=28187 RepID=UPI0005A1E002|nr:hypothetical protein [Acetohalobium arabaticum]